MRWSSLRSARCLGSIVQGKPRSMQLQSTALSERRSGDPSGSDACGSAAGARCSPSPPGNSDCVQVRSTSLRTSAAICRYFETSPWTTAPPAVGGHVEWHRLERGSGRAPGGHFGSRFPGSCRVSGGLFFSLRRRPRCSSSALTGPVITEDWPSRRLPSSCRTQSRPRGTVAGRNALPDPSLERRGRPDRCAGTGLSPPRNELERRGTAVSLTARLVSRTPSSAPNRPGTVRLPGTSTDAPPLSLTMSAAPRFTFAVELAARNIAEPFRSTS